MKHVRKEGEPGMFREWKALAREEWQPTWRDLQAPEKPDLHEALIQEQGAVCCYCGRRITRAGSHIEHFRPRTAYPDRALDYSNLLASCQRNEGRSVPWVCGRAKDDWFDEDSYVDPQEPSCEQRFRFRSQGNVEVQPDDDPAATMVRKLNLNEPFLNELRREILEGAFPNEVLDVEDDAGLTTIADVYGRADEHGRVPDMGHVVRRWLEDFLKPLS